MAFDISRLTGAVNRHLNSISDISRKAQELSEEASARAQFAIDLREAIRANIQNHMPEGGTFPDYGKEIQAAVQQAAEPVSTFGSARTNEAAEPVSAFGSARTTENAIAQNSSTAGALSNKDAYSGYLSMEALQDLSKSKYFNVNLIQNALFDDKDSEGEDSDTKAVTSSTTDAFGSELTLANLNENSLLASDLLATYGKLQKSELSGSVFGDFLL